MGDWVVFPRVFVSGSEKTLALWGALGKSVVSGTLVGLSDAFCACDGYRWVCFCVRGWGVGSLRLAVRVGVFAGVGEDGGVCRTCHVTGPMKSLHVTVVKWSPQAGSESSCHLGHHV